MNMAVVFLVSFDVSFVPGLKTFHEYYSSYFRALERYRELMATQAKPFPVKRIRGVNMKALEVKKMYQLETY